MSHKRLVYYKKDVIRLRANSGMKYADRRVFTKWEKDGEVHNEKRENDIRTRSIPYDGNAGISGNGIGEDRGGYDRH